MAEEFLIVENLTKEFTSGIPVVSDVSFKVSEAGSYGLLGKSGHGKSVIMQAVRGVPEYEPTDGNIIYRISYCPNCHWVDYPSKEGGSCPKCSETMEFREVDYWEELNERTRLSKAVHDRIALMPQRGFALYGERSALMNIVETLRDVGYPKESIGERASELISSVRLDHRRDHIARNLSGGEKQRVIFANCLAKDPLLFLADEPTGTLDPITGELVNEVVRNAIKRDKVSLLVTSHWPEAVREISDRASLLERGEVEMSGPSEEIYDVFMEKVEEPEVERYEGTSPIVKCKGVKKHYYTFDRGLVKAVDGIDLELYEGEIFGLVGLSGSGKTTFAHMIIAIKRTTVGDVLVRVGDEWIDMSVPGPDERGRATAQEDILHQEYSLHDGRIIIDNLTGAIRETLPEEIKTQRAYDVLKAVNFTDDEIDYILYNYPREISEGERQRVAIARSLIREPKIVLLDEPTGTADPLTRIEIARSIRSARDSLGQTYLIISHDIDFIRIACDRAAYMRNGKIVMIGEPEETVGTMVETERAAILGEEG